MKKHLFLATALLISSVGAKAQIEKGTKMIGLNADMSNWTQNRPGVGVVLVPSFQYFVGSNFSINSELALGFLNRKENNYKTSARKYEFITGVKKYFGTKKVKPYIVGGVGFGKESETSINENPNMQPFYYSNQFTYKYLHFSAQLGTGILYSATKYLNVEASVGLRYNDGIVQSTNWYTGPSEYNPYNNQPHLTSYLSPTFRLGVQISLPVKKQTKTSS